ncbi:MAG: RNA methyltransferase, partial [Nitrospinota bacterium]|nr:RNA methyltransferase [Nitrospinota bacterium]
MVLVRPKGARNVGSISRAMGHFGVRRLRLVSPHCDVKSLEARSMAMSGQDILAGAEHFATLREATADCGWLVAASCRRGRNRRSTIEPRADAPLLLRRAAETRLALIFGPEDKGLRTDEVDLCQERLWIP